MSARADSLTLPAQHVASLDLCEQCEELRRDPPSGLQTCAVVAAGVIEATLLAGSAPGYGAKPWRLRIGGEGVGDDPVLARVIGTTARSPVAVRFAEPITLSGVDDTGMVDETFWVNMQESVTLRAIVSKAIEWLSAPSSGDDARRRAAWTEAQEHTSRRQAVIDSFRGLVPCAALVAVDGSLRPEWLAPGLREMRGGADEAVPMAERELWCARLVASGAIEEVAAGVFAFDL